jgi:YHS domain-containing protein
MKIRNISLALVITAALAAAAFGQEAKKNDHSAQHDHGAKAEKADGKFLGKGDGVETCPVTGEKIENKDVKADFFGRTIYFCCAGCVDQVKANPEAYVKKTHAEQVEAVKHAAKSEGHGDHSEHKAAPEAGKVLGKGDGIETCPVTGEPVSKSVKAEIAGRTVYACCPGCLETVKKNPDLYLKKVNNQ